MKERLEERDMEIQRTATENNEADSQTGLMDCGMDLPVMLLAALPMAVGQWGGDRNTAYRHWQLDCEGCHEGVVYILSDVEWVYCSL